MAQLSSGDLAKVLNVSKGRVSQYVSEGKLVGCYVGDGRARRFDLDKAAAALGRRLDQGQLMGNGAATRQALKSIVAQPKAFDQYDPAADEADEDVAPRQLSRTPRDGAELPQKDPDRYELARIQKAEEEARKLRRQNAEAEGTFVLSSEVERQVARMLAQEVAEVEAVLRDGARRVADKLGVDFKEVRQILMAQWRDHRAKRTEVLQAQADTAVLSAVEIAEDI